MFEPLNSTAFKYYTHFMGLYGLAIALFIVARVYVKKMDKNKKHLKRLLTTLSEWSLFYGIAGFILLFCRYAYVYFLSMEFLHILIAAITVLGASSPLYKFYKKQKAA